MIRWLIPLAVLVATSASCSSCSCSSTKLVSTGLVVTSSHPGSSVRVDGHWMGWSSGRWLDVPPGEHEVVLEDDECWEEARGRVIVRKDETSTLNLAPQRRLVVLKIDARDEKGNVVAAKAMLDGRDLGPVPGSFEALACSKLLVVEGAAGRYVLPLRLAEGTALDVLARLAPPNDESGIDFVQLPGGQLEPYDPVAPFALSRMGTTVEQYMNCVAAGACTVPWTGEAPNLHQDEEEHPRLPSDWTQSERHMCNWYTDRLDHPMNCVDLDQAEAFCKWAKARLPSAAEREWAAGSGEDWTYPWGNDPPGARACWDGEGNDVGAGKRRSTCPVGSHPAGASKQGVQDLAGNLWEWTTGTDRGRAESRGGAWYLDDPEYLRAQSERGHSPSTTLSSYGFRCAR